MGQGNNSVIITFFKKKVSELSLVNGFSAHLSLLERRGALPMEGSEPKEVFPPLSAPSSSLTQKGLQAVAIKFVIPPVTGISQMGITKLQSCSCNLELKEEQESSCMVFFLFDSRVAVPESFISLWVVIDHVGNFTVTHIPTFWCVVFS